MLVNMLSKWGGGAGWTCRSGPDTVEPRHPVCLVQDFRVNPALTLRDRYRGSAEVQGGLLGHAWAWRSYGLGLPGPGRLGQPCTAAYLGSRYRGSAGVQGGLLRHAWARRSYGSGVPGPGRLGQPCTAPLLGSRHRGQQGFRVNLQVWARRNHRLLRSRSRRFRSLLLRY